MTRAIRIHEHGGPEVLRWDEVDPGTPGTGQALIRQTAAGLNFIDVLSLFNDDDDTDGVIMIGEIGGDAEETAAAWAKEHCNKPIAAFIAGATAPPGRRMGHAGAIISGGKGTAAAKKEALLDAGIAVAQTPSEMGSTLAKLL